MEKYSSPIIRAFRPAFGGCLKNIITLILAIASVQGVAQSYDSIQTLPFDLVISSDALPIPECGDIDNDGDLDLFVGSTYGKIDFYENIGSDTVPAFANRITNAFSLTNIGSQSAAPTLVDIDNDGDLDLFSGSYDGGIYFFENTGSVSSPSFATKVANPFSISYTFLHSSIAFGDIDADGDLDMISGSQDQYTYFFENIGTATNPQFSAPSTNPFGLSSMVNYNRPEFYDFDGDNDLDLLFGVGNGSFSYFENIGTASAPSFAAAVTNPFGLTSIENYATPALGDFNNDGDPDLFSGHLFKDIFYLENLSLPQTITWTGQSSSDWNNSNNWTGGRGVPNYENRVIIPFVSFNNTPVINDPINIKRIDIASSGYLNIGAGGSIQADYVVTKGVIEVEPEGSFAPLHWVLMYLPMTPRFRMAQTEVIVSIALRLPSRSNRGMPIFLRQQAP